MLSNHQIISVSCHKNEENLDCSKTQKLNINAIICKVRRISFTPEKIRLRFPQDDKGTNLKERMHCTSSEFINGFNEDGEGSIHQAQKELTLYGTLFDLAVLKKHTNETITKKVFIIADIVHLSESLYITYDLFIRARKVYINNELTMDMNFKTFKSKQKYYVVHSKQFRFRNGDFNLSMRHRRYGRVDILDSYVDTLEDNCSPKIFPSKANCSKMSCFGWLSASSQIS